MKDIYFLVLLVLTSIGSAYITTILPRVKTRLSTFIKRRRSKITTRVANLEANVKSHEEQINNLAKTMPRRTRNDRDFIRKEVKEYLIKLQK